MFSRAHGPVEEVVMPENYLFRLRRRWWVLLIVLIAIIALVALQLGVSNSELITEIAHEATSKAAANARVVERLGSGVVMSGQHSGQVLDDRGGRRVNVVVPVAGSRGRGRLYATGVVQDDGHAKLSSLAVVTGRERIEVPIE
jgi:hypothetical protein